MQCESTKLIKEDYKLYNLKIFLSLFFQVEDITKNKKKPGMKKHNIIYLYICGLLYLKLLKNCYCGSNQRAWSAGSFISFSYFCA